MRGTLTDLVKSPRSTSREKTVLAQRQAMRILAQNAVDLIDERYEGYRADGVRKLKAIIDAQARFESDAKRHQEVLAELDALAGIVSSRRGSA